MNFGLNLWNKAVCRMHGLVVIEGMTLSGHPWIINEIMRTIWWGKWFYHPINFLFFHNNLNPQWNSIGQKLVPICFTATYTFRIISEVIRVSECSTCIDYIDVVTELPCLFPGLIWPFFDFQMSWIHTLKWVNQVIKMLSTVNNVYLNFLFFNNNSNWCNLVHTVKSRVKARLD